MTTSSPRRLEHPSSGEILTFLETSAETGGLRTLVEVVLDPGASTPLHRHLTYTETFEVLEGRLTVRRDGVTTQLGPGDAVAVPPRSVHRFANETDARVCFRCAITPGQPGFERMQQVGYGLLHDGRVSARGLPRDPRHLGLALAWSDTRLVGPARGVGAPLAWLGRHTGEERRLVARYCRW